MDFQLLLEKYRPLLSQYWLPITLALFGLMFLVYGLMVLLGGFSSSKDIVFEAGGEATESAKVKEIIVDVSGAVLKPGVYRLPFDARVQDALVAAGGLSEAADRGWVAKNLNLALKLKDGTKIYIPSSGESTTRSASSGQASTTGSTGGTGLININTASEGELDSLPGIGPITAQKIINARPFDSVEDLLNKKIVGSKVFEQIKEKITVY